MYPEMFNCLPEGKGKNITPNINKLAAEGNASETSAQSANVSRVYFSPDEIGKWNYVAS